MGRRVAIIDYGAGNLRSVANAVKKLGYESLVTDKPEDALRAEAVILPGVGSAADTMTGLEKVGMASVIKQLLADDKPFFAVCIGLQILFTETDEGGRHKCLDVVSGRVKRLQYGLKVPHIGWNQVRQQKRHWLFEGIADGADFYFVHSYYGDPEEKTTVIATTDYGLEWCSVLGNSNLVATQFHPEKSGENGLRMYENFLKRFLGE